MPKLFIRAVIFLIAPCVAMPPSLAAVLSQSGSPIHRSPKYSWQTQALSLPLVSQDAAVPGGGPHGYEFFPFYKKIQSARAEAVRHWAVQESRPWAGSALEFTTLMQELTIVLGAHTYCLKQMLNLMDENLRVRELGLHAIDILNGKLLNIGLDESVGLSNNMVGVLRRRHVNILGLAPEAWDDVDKGYAHGVVQDMRQFPDGAIDAMISVALFHWAYIDMIHHGEESAVIAQFYRQAASEIHRVLKDKGVFLLDAFEPNKNFLAECRNAGMEAIPLSNKGKYLLINRKSAVLQAA